VSTNVAHWLPLVFGVIAFGLTIGLVIDLLRRKN